MKFFKENIGLKLVSVVLALLLWLIVFNVSNPEQKGTRTVELNILNQDAFSSEIAHVGPLTIDFQKIYPGIQDFSSAILVSTYSSPRSARWMLVHPPRAKVEMSSSVANFFIVFLLIFFIINHAL